MESLKNQIEEDPGYHMYLQKTAVGSPESKIEMENFKLVCRKYDV